MKRFAFLFLILVLFAGPALAADAAGPLPEKVLHGDGPATYPAECARRLEAGKALLDQGDLAGARQELARAAEADAGEPMVSFYQAIVAYRQGDYQEALNRADSGTRAVLEDYNYGGAQPENDPRYKRFVELEAAIKQRIEAVAKGDPDQLQREGDEAYGKGLLAKAATAYARAFRADPTRGETGLEAASLYADRLKNLLEAAILWQEVIAAGEPHATVARTELQSHRDALEAVLQQDLAGRDQWRKTGEPAAVLRLAQAFPESTELQVELAILFARRNQVDEVLQHLQSASRLGLGADDFLAQPDLMAYLGRTGLDSGAGGRLAEFLRDAYGDEVVTRIRTGLKRRADETARLAGEKAEKEREARLAQELGSLTRWRDAERLKAVQEVNALIGARNGLEVEMAEVQPGKKRRAHFTMTRSNSLGFQGGEYRFSLWQRLYIVRQSTGTATPEVQEESISLPSFAPWRGLEVWPSSWEKQPVRLGDSGATPNSLPVDPAQRTLGREVLLTFSRPAKIHRQQTVTYEFETADGATSSGFDSSSDLTVKISALLEDREVARLKSLFETLARLDAAGNDIDELGSLRAAGNGSN